MTAANQIAQTIISDPYFLKLYRVCVERSVLRTLSIDTEEKYTEKRNSRLIAICRFIIDLFHLGCA